MPGVRDAVASPRGDLVIALISDSLVAIRVENGQMRRLGRGIPNQGDIVMAEWAIGRNVERWNRQAPLLLTAYPVPPEGAGGG